MSPMPHVFSRLVGLIDRLRRTDSDEKSEPIVCKPLSRTVGELDVDFMLRWVRALSAMRSVVPRGSKVPGLVSTNSPQVTLQLTAVADGLAQLQKVFAKLDENASNKFVLVDIGKDALLDAAIIAGSGKPGIVEADKGRFDTGAAWREKLENVATLFKDKVATVNPPRTRPQSRSRSARRSATHATSRSRCSRCSRRPRRPGSTTSRSNRASRASWRLPARASSSSGGTFSTGAPPTCSILSC
jgi:hypothetical protein